MKDLPPIAVFRVQDYLDLENFMLTLTNGYF